jgi:hypothetical protein
VNAGAPFPPGGLEILDSGDNRRLVLGAFLKNLGEP